MRSTGKRDPLRLFPLWAALGLVVLIVGDSLLRGELPLREALAACFMPAVVMAEATWVIVFVTEDLPAEGE